MEIIEHHYYRVNIENNIKKFNSNIFIANSRNLFELHW